jgi:hypothetical protein
MFIVNEGMKKNINSKTIKTLMELFVLKLWVRGSLRLLCLTPHSTIFQLYHDRQ